MAYKIVSQAKAWWPIRWGGVTDDGAIVENEIEGRFIILDEDEFQQFEEDIADIGSELAAVGDDKRPEERQRLSELLSPFILRILENWKDVTDEEGEVPFSKSSLERMLRVPNFAAGVAESYRKCRKAEPERRKGN